MNDSRFSKRPKNLIFVGPTPARSNFLGLWMAIGWKFGPNGVISTVGFIVLENMTIRFRAWLIRPRVLVLIEVELGRLFIPIYGCWHKWWSNGSDVRSRCGLKNRSPWSLGWEFESGCLPIHHQVILEADLIPWVQFLSGVIRGIIVQVEFWSIPIHWSFHRPKEEFGLFGLLQFEL